MNTQLLEKLNDLAKIANEIPGVLVVHRLDTMFAVYMSPKGLALIGLTLEELKCMGIHEYHSRYFNPDDAAEYTPRVTALLANGDENEIVSFFQQVRTSENKKWDWFLSTSKIFMKDKNGTPTHMVTISCPVDIQHNITGRMNRLLEENSFIPNNLHIFASLTKREKEILKAMAKGESSKKIALDLNISQTTVSTHRRNVRSKLHADSHYSIMHFAQAFDLI